MFAYRLSHRGIVNAVAIARDCSRSLLTSSPTSYQSRPVFINQLALHAEEEPADFAKCCLAPDLATSTI